MSAMATLIDLLRSPWAVIPDRLEEIQAIYATHVRGEKIDIGAIEARLGRPLANEQQDYTIRDGGIAVLPIRGVMAPRATMLTQISGGTTADALTKQLESMALDPRVRGAVLAWDSPGGSVQGIPALAASIRALADAKPLVSVSEGTMASAAYWTGSAANAIYASGETDTLGSIGVVARHSYDPRNTTTTEITAGRYKRIVSDTAPLTKEGRAYMQAQVDEIYAVFVETVAANRRASVEDVLSRMADGRIFIGRQARDAGLIDGFATVDTMVERMATNPDKFAKRGRAVFALGGLPAAGAAAAEPTATTGEQPPATTITTTIEDHHMTPTEAAAKFAAENPEAAALLRAEGATAETKRAAEVRAAGLPGHEALIERLAADGKTTGAQAALAVVAAEQANRAAQATARTADAPKPVQQVPVEADANADTAQVAASASKGDLLTNPAALDKAARAYQAKNPGTDYLAAIRAVQLEA